MLILHYFVIMLKFNEIEGINMRALDLAKYIINTSKKGLSNLELQKTMYFVELDYCKNTKKHLVDDDFEAWQYGPVVPEVYWKYRNYGACSIDATDDGIDLNNICADEIKIINSSIIRCNKKYSWDMVAESHREDGAWKKTIDKGLAIIGKELIREEALKYGI